MTLAVSGHDARSVPSWVGCEQPPLTEEPELAELFARRNKVFGSRRHSDGTTLNQWDTALCDAGFAEVGTLIQINDRRLLVAIR